MEDEPWRGLTTAPSNGSVSRSNVVCGTGIPQSRAHRCIASLSLAISTVAGSLIAQRVLQRKVAYALNSTSRVGTISLTSFSATTVSTASRQPGSPTSGTRITLPATSLVAEHSAASIPMTFQSRPSSLVAFSKRRQSSTRRPDDEIKMLGGTRVRIGVRGVIALVLSYGAGLGHISMACLVRIRARRRLHILLGALGAFWHAGHLPRRSPSAIRLPCVP
ncbi:MAG: hypothetical protein JWM95_2527 [Gemmatimonadetes bacterium]|nr:hypothetical protein [Gemmatimonadota bacterium]